MKRMMINATLFNVSTEDDEYMELRRHMVDEVTAEELNQPAHILRDLLEDYVSRMFADMEDEVLQQHYEEVMKYKETETEANVRKMVESAEEETNGL